MTFLPFKRSVFQASLDIDEVLNRLQEKTHVPLSNFDVGEMIDKTKIFEMKRLQSSFVVGKGAGVLKYGKMSTFPVMKGKLKSKNDLTYVEVVIKPRSFFSPVFGLLFIIPAIYFGVTNPDYGALAMGIFLLLVTYLFLIVSFNRVYKEYLSIVDEAVSSL